MTHTLECHYTIEKKLNYQQKHLKDKDGQIVTAVTPLPLYGTVTDAGKMVRSYGIAAEQ